MISFSSVRARKLLEAVAAWLHFEKMCHREDLFREGYLAHPISQFLTARFGDSVRAECVHPVLARKSKGPGAKPKIDFAIVEGADDIKIAIETKWASGSGTLLRDILHDLVRLELLARAGAVALLILAGRNRNLSALFRHAMFRAHPDHPKSKPLLPLPPPHGTGHARTIHLEHPAPRRRDLVASACEGFKVRIPSSLRLVPLDPFTSNRNRDYRVLGWLVESVTPRTTFHP